MLEQYRKDLPNEDKDLLPDNESKMGKQKIILFLSGTTLALVAFLFFTGAFSKDESLEQSVQVELASKESVLQVEEKLQVLQVKMEKLEKELAAAQFVAMSSSEKREVSEVVVNMPPLASVDDAVAMTNSSLRNLIAKEAAPKPEVVAVKAPAKGKKVDTAKAGKSKGKTAQAVAAGDASSRLYVVQNGDTLSKISSRYFGTPNRWKTIYDANRDRIANINRLKVGTKLVIPDSAR